MDAKGIFGFGGIDPTWITMATMTHYAPWFLRVSGELGAWQRCRRG